MILYRLPASAAEIRPACISFIVHCGTHLPVPSSTGNSHGTHSTTVDEAGSR